MSAPSSLHREFADALHAADWALPHGFRVSAGYDRVRRFAVHRNKFVLSLIDALAESFPVTQAVVGVDFFRALARERVLADPPRSPLLNDYALAFPDFIAAFAPASTVPCLADLARLEAGRIRAYHAADAAPLADTAYRALLADPLRLSRTRLRLHPVCAWLRSRYAVYSIWHAHQGLADLAEAQLDRVDVDQPEDVLIARPALDVVTLPLPVGAVEWLDALAQGHSLTGACSRARAEQPRTNDAELFTLLIQHGLAVSFDSCALDSSGLDSISLNKPHGELT